MEYTLETTPVNRIRMTYVHRSEKFSEWKQSTVYVASFEDATRLIDKWNGKICNPIGLWEYRLVEVTDERMVG